MMMRSTAQIPGLLTVFVVRRGYGRRYSDLPVDQLSAQGLMIDCSAGHLRPQHIDLLVGDLVRWRTDAGYVEAPITAVRRQPQRLTAEFGPLQTLPEDFFPY